MKIIGIVFVVASASTVGFQMAAVLRDRCQMLRMLLASLQVLKSEIEVCGTPLPQAFALMAASVNGPLETLYSTVAKDMDTNRWVTPFEAVKRAVEQWEEPYAPRLLLPLARMLGKYDIDAQIQGITLAQRDAEELLREAEQEQKIKSRTYRTLGVCTGLAVSILLL